MKRKRFSSKKRAAGISSSKTKTGIKTRIRTRMRCGLKSGGGVGGSKILSRSNVETRQGHRGQAVLGDQNSNRSLPFG
jgi:hypothetical protein